MRRFGFLTKTIYPVLMNDKKTSFTNHLGFIDGTTLKLIAMVAMLLDHACAALLPGWVFLHYIGRISLPIFAFCLAEGYSHTHDKKKHLLRMGVFAVISEVPFDLLFNNAWLDFSYNNVLITFFIALLGLAGYDAAVTKVKNRTAGTALGFLLIVLACGAAYFINCDHSYFAVFLVFVFYFLREQNRFVCISVGAIMTVAMRNDGIARWTVLGCVPLLFYNGKKGRGLKWLFYVFYPVHLVILVVLRCLLAV